VSPFSTNVLLPACAVGKFSRICVRDLYRRHSTRSLSSLFPCPLSQRPEFLRRHDNQRPIDKFPYPPSGMRCHNPAWMSMRFVFQKHIACVRSLKIRLQLNSPPQEVPKSSLPLHGTLAAGSLLGSGTLRVLGSLSQAGTLQDHGSLIPNGTLICYGFARASWTLKRKWLAPARWYARNLWLALPHWYTL